MRFNKTRSSRPRFISRSTVDPVTLHIQLLPTTPKTLISLEPRETDTWTGPLNKGGPDLNLSGSGHKQFQFYTVTHSDRLVQCQCSHCFCVFVELQSPVCPCADLACMQQSELFSA